MPDITITRNFSRAAADYDDHARVQAQVARDLLKFSQYDNPPLSPLRKGGSMALPSLRRRGWGRWLSTFVIGSQNTMLELGCGTGLYTRMLLDSFPDAAVRAIDISDAMIEVARRQISCSRASFLCADAETFTAGKYDIITSNASLHWFCNLQRTLENLYGMLDNGGRITFSYFGPNTYRELQESLACVAGPSSRLASSSFLTAGEVTKLLGTVFRVSEVEEREYEETFISLWSLLESIKLTGTRGAGSGSGIIWTRGLLRDLESAYTERFDGIRATYQVYMCRAQK
ncbi:MAG: methyltransferase domain-containing protein [Armatimonadota bacterium]